MLLLCSFSIDPTGQTSPYNINVDLKNKWSISHRNKDSLPEWSKGVDSSSTSASCVGSNPTAVIVLLDLVVGGMLVWDVTTEQCKLMSCLILPTDFGSCFGWLLFELP